MKWGRRLKRSVLAIGLGLFFAVLGSGSVVQAQEPDYGTMYIFSGGEIKGFQTAYLNSIPEENGYKSVSYTHLDVYKRQMLNMGFREDIETILEGVPEERQTVLFSATMPKPILDITKRFQKNAELIKVTKK